MPVSAAYDLVCEAHNLVCAAHVVIEEKDCRARTCLGLPRELCECSGCAMTDCTFGAVSEAHALAAKPFNSRLQFFQKHIWLVRWPDMEVWTNRML